MGSTFAGIQLDAEGNVATDEQVDQMNQANSLDGVKKVEVNAHKHSMRLQGGNLAAQADAFAAETEGRVNRFHEQLDLMRSQTSAGMVLSDGQLRDLQNELNDIDIAYAKLGGDPNDDAMVGLRDYVDAIAAEGRKNRR